VADHIVETMKLNIVMCHNSSRISNLRLWPTMDGVTLLFQKQK